MFSTWCLIIGVLLILIGLSDTWRQRLPVSTSALYLVAGYLLGPQGFGFIQIGLPNDADIVEVMSEIPLDRCPRVSVFTCRDVVIHLLFVLFLGEAHVTMTIPGALPNRAAPASARSPSSPAARIRV